MRFACWVTKATEVYSEYEILTDFQREQWLRERASMLSCVYIACLTGLKKSLSLFDNTALGTPVCDVGDSPVFSVAHRNALQLGA